MCQTVGHHTTQHVDVGDELVIITVVAPSFTTVVGWPLPLIGLSLGVQSSSRLPYLSLFSYSLDDRLDSSVEGKKLPFLIRLPTIAQFFVIWVKVVLKTFRSVKRVSCIDVKPSKSLRRT